MLIGGRLREVKAALVCMRVEEMRSFRTMALVESLSERFYRYY